MAISPIVRLLTLFDNKMPIESDSTIELLTISDVSSMLNISESGVRRLIDKRHLPFFKVMKSVRFSREDVSSYLSENRIEPIGLNKYGN
jgi:excisionase family DNA binding protein